jgi:hypothetical protein
MQSAINGWKPNIEQITKKSQQFQAKDGSLKPAVSQISGQPYKVQTLSAYREHYIRQYLEKHPAVTCCLQSLDVDMDHEGTVFEPFGGCTLIACERTNRRCFLMEIDPVYG